MNILIIGFGKIGKIRYQILKKNRLVKKIYIYDPAHKKLKDLLFISNLNKIDKLMITASFICSPTYLSTKYCSLLIKKNIHVFCEKPPSTNIKDLLALKKIKDKNKKINLMYGFNHRHHESIKKILKIIASKKYGKILWIRGRYGKPIDDNYLQGWRGDLEKSGGGILIDQGIHLLDLMILFLGKFKIIKSLLSNNFIKKNIEDNAFIILKNKNNQTASLHSTLTQWRHLFSLEIFFQKGYVVLNGLKTPSNSYGKEILTYCRNLKIPPKIKWSKIYKNIYKVDNSFETETNYFIKFISDKKKINICSIYEAINLMNTIKKIYTQNQNIFK